jgi:hypothetical protein
MPTSTPTLVQTGVPFTVEERNLIRAALRAYARMLAGNVTGRLGGQIDTDEAAENARLLVSVRAKLAAAAEVETAAVLSGILEMP